ncbi:MAG: phosphatidylserine/phosphatidylglycerophosphate/cardiolipin synthase family protein [Steroidobacteraceae bacterium]
MPHYSLPKLLPPRFSWRNGNQFELLVDGLRYFPVMLDAIQQAQHNIELEMYLASSGEVFSQFIAALVQAAQRGVIVRILFDGFGSLQVSPADRQQLRTSGIRLQFYNQLRWRQGVGNLLRNHRKLLLIDRQLAFVGGTGLVDEFLHNRTVDTPWHEVMLSVRGPVVADWNELFDRSWFGLSRKFFKAKAAAITPILAGNQQGRVSASNGPHAHHVAQSLHMRIATSTQRTWLVTPYFLPSLQLRYLLIEAAKRKLDVRILVPGQLTDHPRIRQASRRHYARLLKNGVRIFEYQPRFIHAKIALCDDWVSVGSTNFDRWNLRWNLDANQEINDGAFAEKVQKLLLQDFAQSEELHYTTWLQRPWYSRMQEWFNGKLEQLLNRLN